MGENYLDERGIALPLMLIFLASFIVLAGGILSMSIEEMKLVSNFEHSVRAFYYAEGALNEAVAGYLLTGGTGSYEYNSAGPQGQVAARAQITQLPEGQTVRATGYSGNVSKRVEVKVQVQNGSLILSGWKDYGVPE